MGGWMGLQGVVDAVELGVQRVGGGEGWGPYAGWWSQHVGTGRRVRCHGVPAPHRSYFGAAACLIVGTCPGIAHQLAPPLTPLTPALAAPTRSASSAHPQGGYFVINGSEKVLIAQERMANNHVYVFKKSQPSKYTFCAEIRWAGGLGLSGGGGSSVCVRVSVCLHAWWRWQHAGWRGNTM